MTDLVNLYSLQKIFFAFSKKQNKSAEICRISSSIVLNYWDWDPGGWQIFDLIRRCPFESFGNNTSDSLVTSKYLVISGIFKISITFSFQNVFNVPYFRRHFSVDLRVRKDYRNFLNFLCWKSEHISPELIVVLREAIFVKKYNSSWSLLFDDFENISANIITSEWKIKSDFLMQCPT